jgi:NADH dehydrogenase
MQGLVTVFGGAGFVGTQVVRALAKRGYRVRVACRRTNLAYRAPLMGDVGQIEVMQANIRMPASVERALEGAEACVNAVGVLHEQGRQRFHSLHAQGARNIAEAAARQGVSKLVHISAIGADPRSPARYAASKGLGEQAVREAFPKAVIIRPSAIFGAEDGLFNRFAQMALVSPVLPAPGGGVTRLQPVYVADVAAAVAACVADPAAAGRTYELGGPAVMSLRQLMQTTLDQIQRSRPILPLPWAVAGLLGRLGDLASILPLPIAPPITSDQVRLLKADNVVDPKLPGLAALGVTPTAVEAIIPTYLYRYRPGGQFAEAALVPGVRN